jgi:acyl carrier protein
MRRPGGILQCTHRTRKADHFLVRPVSADWLCQPGHRSLYRRDGSESAHGGVTMNRRSLWTGFLSWLLLAFPRTARAADCTDKVRKIIIEQLGVPAEKVTLQARLAEDLGADSLDCIELVMALEEEFKTPIPDEAASRVRTVGDIISYLKREIRQCA